LGKTLFIAIICAIVGIGMMLISMWMDDKEEQKRKPALTYIPKKHIDERR